jgi:prophage regulatory protein
VCTAECTDRVRLTAKVALPHRQVKFSPVIQERGTKSMKVVEPNRFLRLPAVQQRVPFSKSMIYQMIQDGTFPAPHRLSARVVAWLENDVSKFIEDRIASEPAIPRPPGLPLRTTRGK